MADALKKRDIVENVAQNTKKDGIFIKGARGNNLKNVDLFIPRNKLVVVTGVSGSGKSSITIDTLFAEGQRRYVESLSSYARQFLMRMKKPDVDYISGICPAIAIEQKVSTSNARSTVGTLTEIYDYLRLLYARMGKTYSPVSGEEVKRHSVHDVVEFIQGLEEGSKVVLLAPFRNLYERPWNKELELLLKKGYTRIELDGEILHAEDILKEEKVSKKIENGAFNILIDRFVVRKEDEENRKRISDSVGTAFLECGGQCIVRPTGAEDMGFNNRFELDGITFVTPTPQLFNYNNPFGACRRCEGFSMVIGIDAEKVIPNKSLSIFDEAIACWKGDKLSAWKDKLIKNAHQFDFPVHRPYVDLTEAQKELLWKGNKYFRGINAFFKELEEKAYKIQNRVLIARYRGRTTCDVCGGHRLRPEALYVKVGGKHIGELLNMPVRDLQVFFKNLDLDEHDSSIGRRLLLEITNRLTLMMDVGLPYLNLGRRSASLSGGETQRLNLTRTLGSNLTSSIYILDEPSIGLHPRDTNRLIEVLRSLRDLGNTVVIVEHEEEMIKNADYLVDMGPRAGIHGGEVVFAGPYEQCLKEAKDSLTTAYMTGKMSIPLPKVRRKCVDKISIKGALEHNLKNIDVDIPLNCLTVVTGVSGSGKTTLIKSILYPALKGRLVDGVTEKPGLHRALEGSVSSLTQVEMVGQNPIGKSSRSNPVTYVKAYDAIRKLFAEQQRSKIHGFQPKHFSFNVDGGRCDNCQGEGETLVEMQFLADVRLPCEDCQGKRFKPEVLDVKYKGKSIHDVLELSIEEALAFFDGNKEIVKKLQPLFNVGLGYVKLGQSSSSLSGGEAQRVKLASFLGKERSTEKILFIFDEPTTGLHFHDIRKLLDALNALVEKGHTVLVIEHNGDVIKMADWVVDLGPEGGDGGGTLLYQGAPEGLLKVKASYTGQFLKEKMKKKINKK